MACCFIPLYQDTTTTITLTTTTTTTTTTIKITTTVTMAMIKTTFSPPIPSIGFKGVQQLTNIRSCTQKYAAFDLIIVELRGILFNLLVRKGEGHIMMRTNLLYTGILWKVEGDVGADIMSNLKHTKSGISC